MPQAEIHNQNDKLPPCKFCGGQVIFTGNELADGKWTQTHRHHFLCTIYGKTFHLPSSQPFRFMYGTRIEEEAKEGKTGDEDGS